MAEIDYKWENHELTQEQTGIAVFSFMPLQGDGPKKGDVYG
jgi:hypothetical protein